MQEAPTLVDKILTTLFDPQIQEALYVAPKADVLPLGRPMSMYMDEEIRLAVAPQHPIYTVAQLHSELVNVAALFKIRHDLVGRMTQIANESRLWMVFHDLSLGELTYTEDAAIVKRTEIASLQPTSEAWQRLGIQVPIYGAKTETFPRKVSIVMYPDKKFALESFEPDKPAYRIQMSQIKEHQREYSQSGLLV